MRRTRQARGPERGGRRRGVSVIELLVALVATGLALMAARLMIEQIADAGVTLDRDARQEDATANGERMMRILAGRAEVSPDSVRRFRGDELSTSFDSWCERSAGWVEHCRVTLAIATATDSSAITAVLSTGEVLHLRNVAGPAVFRFVARDSAGVRWLESWGRSITAPYALGIVHGSDTIVVRIGERG